jgi:hypothetical protein
VFRLLGQGDDYKHGLFCRIRFSLLHPDDHFAVPWNLLAVEHVFALH